MNIYIHIYIHHIYIYMYVYICVCVYVSVSVCVYIYIFSVRICTFVPVKQVNSVPRDLDARTPHRRYHQQIHLIF